MDNKQMHTNISANIAIANSSSCSIRWIDLNWDGSPDAAGKILLENYTTTDEVEELIYRGDMSVLREIVEACEYYFDEDDATGCWKDCEPRLLLSATISQMIAGYHHELKRESFLYIWDDSSEMWFVMDGRKTVVPLETYEL